MENPFAKGFSIPFPKPFGTPLLRIGLRYFLIFRLDLIVVAIVNSLSCDGYEVFARISWRRFATMASSPGSIIQTPMPNCCCDPGLGAMLGLPSRS